jgi:Holliday junction resolvasome RuvABC endonuclease subunit
MRILSIDQALLHSSFAIFEDGKYKSHFSWELKRKDNSDEICYETFYKYIFESIKKEKPDIVVCERMWLGFNAKVFGMLQELVGIIRAICIQRKIRFETIPIATYRCFYKIKNNKEIANEFIRKCYPEVDMKNSDEADAILLGKYIADNFEMMEKNK